MTDYIDLSLESQNIRIKTVDNGDGTFSIAVPANTSTVVISGVTTMEGAVTISGTPTVILMSGIAHLGQVGGHTACVDAQVTMTSGTGFVSGDYVGVNGTPITFANCGRVNGGTGMILGAILVDKALQSVAGELWLFDTTVTPPNDSVAWTITDADALKCIGIIPFSTYYASAANSICPVGNLSIAYSCAADSKNLYGCFVTRGAPTYTSNDLYIRLRMLQD